MKGSYDIAVVGSGIGGMCAAALAAHKGYRVLVAERLPFIGGRCSDYEYKGFKLSTGAIGLHPGGATEGVFKEVGANFDIVLEPGLQFRIEGKDYTMPSHGGGLRWLMSQVSGEEGEPERVMGAIRRAFRWKEPSGTQSFRDWLTQYTQNERILGIFQSLIPALMVINSYEMPANAAIRFLEIARGIRTNGFAREGNLSLMQSLARVVEGKGGQVWTGSPVKKILVSDEVVKGVVVEREGKEVEIEAKAVISNTGPIRTVELAGSENFERGYLKQMGDTIREGPVLWFQTAIHTPEFKHPGVLMPVGMRRVNTTLCPSKACPQLAPPGKHLLLSGSAPLSSLPPIDYQKEIDLHIQDLRDLFPEFDKYGEVMVAGCYERGWPGFRSWPGFMLPQKTPVEHLYNVGDAVVHSARTGTIGAAESARIVVEDLSRRIELTT